MKKNSLLLLLVFLSFNSFSQNTFVFGDWNKIFTYDTSLIKYGEIYNPSNTTPSYLTSNEKTKLLPHINGKIYGVATKLDPTNSESNIFYFDTTTKLRTNIISIGNSSPFSKPNNYLTNSSNGFIYGSSKYGGSFDGKGTIFSINPTTNNYKQETNFTSDDVQLFSPISFDKYDSIIIVSYLFGGPKNKGGCEFISNTTGAVIKTIYYGSTGNTAGNYVSGLLKHPNGWLYGVNAYAQGSMFMRINPVTGYAENMINSSMPYLGPNLPVQKTILGSDGNIYGTNRDGGIFSYDVRDDSVINKSYSYFADIDGFTGNFFDRPIEKNGKMYHIEGGYNAMEYDVTSTADNGLGYPGNFIYFHSSLTKVGSEIYFSAFDDWSGYEGHLSKYDTTLNQMTIIHSFSTSVGSSPEVIRTHSSGLIIGITKLGGSKNSGVVFSFNPQTYQYNVLCNLDSLVEGRTPLKEILELPNGNILFATKQGSLYGDGAIVILNINTQLTTIIKNFKLNSNLLANPIGEMLEINNSLYGIATTGGEKNRGGIFKFNPSTNTITDVASFVNYQLQNPFAPDIVTLNDKIYGIVDSVFSVNHTFIFECDPNTNNFTIKKSLGDANIGANIVPTQPFTVLNNKLVSIGDFAGNTVIFSYDVVTNNLSIDYTFPAGFFINQGISEPLTMLDNTTALLSVRTNSTGIIGTLWRYDYINHTLNQVSTLPDLNHPNYYQFTGVPTKMGNKFYGLTSTGIYYTQGSYVYYYGDPCYFYSFDNLTSNVKIEKIENSVTPPNNISNIFKFNGNIITFLPPLGFGNNVVLRKFKNDRSHQDFSLSNVDSSSVIYASFQLQDSLIYYIKTDYTNQWIYKVNLNTMINSLVYTGSMSNYQVYDLYKVDATLYAVVEDLNSGDISLQKIVAGNLIFIENDIEISYYFTDGIASLFKLSKNTTTYLDAIYKYDTQNNDLKSLYFNLTTDAVASNSESFAWCRKIGNNILGFCGYPSSWSGKTPGLFNINTQTNQFSIDTFYINNGTPDLSYLKNIEGNVIMCGDYNSNTMFKYHNIVTHQTKSALNFYLQNGNGNVFLLNDSSNVSITSAMESTCLSSKQVLVANAEVANATYKWYKNYNEILNATNDTLVINNFTPSDSGYYSCKIGSNWAEQLSNSIHLDFDYCNPVYPGDANSDGVVDGADIIQIGLGYGSSGLARTSVSNIYTAYNSNDWSSFAPNNLNNKHPDCNGDGMVNFSDTVAISLNYLQLHPLQITLTNSENNEEMRIPPISVKLMASQSIYTPGNSGYVDVVIGDLTNPVTNIYGLYYKIEYNNQVVTNVSINPKYSWLMSPIATKISAGNVDNTLHVIDGAIVRHDHTDTIGFGATARIYFNTTNTIFTDIETAFTIKKISLLNSQALRLPLVVDSLAQFNYSTVTGVVFTNNNSINMWINEDVFRIHSSDVLNAIVEIYDLQGRLIIKQNMNSTDELINMSKEANGMYLVRINELNGNSYRKKIIKN